MNKHIFITGGVVSSLGKGIVSSALGTILESRGLSVTILKLDPYINIDPGTMSPAQHGEVFVTRDGAETDLDLGHYERFISTNLNANNNFTAGRVYENVIKRERRGDYLGATVQVVPHITEEIKRLIKVVDKNYDITLVEVGGTVGDIESLPFLEAIRQLSLELDKTSSLFIHLTLVPYIAATQELKTKPTQHSVKELRGIGIQPDILICRSVTDLPPPEKEKIALFTNVETASVFTSVDVNSIYKVPEKFHEQGLDDVVVKKLSIKCKNTNLNDWKKIVYKLDNPQSTVNIAMVGKYVEFADSYKSLNEALIHAGIHTLTKINIHYIDSKVLDSPAVFEKIDGIVVPGGFGNRGIAGKILAAKYAREKNVPYLGICLGMQIAIIEYAKNVLGLQNANSTEFDKKTDVPVVALVTEWQDEKGGTQTRNKFSKLGGTMRLGEQKCILNKKSKIYQIYNKSAIFERHRHRYEVNNNFIDRLKNAGLLVSGISKDQNLVEVVENPNNNFFIATQFHPEFTSNPRTGHPLFNAFINSCK